MGSNRRATIALRLVEGLLLVVGLVSVGWYASVRIAATREQASLSHELDRLSALPTPDVSPGARMVPALRALVARIEMPRLNLSALAREGVDVRTLRLAVGHIPGTAFPGERGNAGFAAHRDTFFRPLKSVREGDEVIVTTPGGVYRYAVTSTQIVEPENISVLDPTPGATLTLVTCYPFDYLGNAPRRFIVRAALQN
jgi:sortase A